MIDINTRCIIDILNSRDTQDVAQWLKEYPNLNLIVRDGSTSFKAAIEASHPNAIQVNDRFHMLKNLIRSVKKVLQRLIVGRIEIPLTSTEAKQRYMYLLGLTRKEKIIEAKKLRKEGLSLEKIAKQLHISATTAAKYVKTDTSELKENYITKREKENIDAINKVKYKVERVHMLHKQGLQIKEISSITGYSSSSISKYISEDYNVVHGQYGVARPGPLAPYRNEILTKIISDFKNILVEKDLSKFVAWMEDVAELKIKELDGYIKGIKSDYNSIINAIMFDYNNGLAEGSVNKLKTIKRIMYGRNNFELLVLV